MIRVEEKEKCCGCTACSIVCHRKAITMQADEEGFKYPKVDEDKCIDCGLCEKVCPMNSPAVNPLQQYSEVVAVQNKNEAVRQQSTAGGFFSAIAEKILQEGGCVCAAGWDSGDYIFVAHKIVTEKVHLDEMRGSKYVQSDLKNVFKEIKELLNAGIRCLFVGTPCQVNALRKVVGFTKSLVTIDFLCLGVSSPYVFESWLSYLEDKYKWGKITVVRFRDKSFGYNTANIRVEFQNHKKIEQKYDVKSYLRTFFHGYNMRPTCYDCKFRCIQRASDFTMGDYHQIGQVNKSMDDDKGTTIVWINSNEGKELFSEINSLFRYHIIENQHEGIIGGVGKLTEVPKDREQFFIDLKRYEYKKLIDKWEPNSFRDVVVNFIKIAVNRTPLKTFLFKAIKRRKMKAFKKRVESANAVNKK